ncbi:MAG: BlaI/MecI/CopY family transcriptional regulator [Candidatus Korobacteraceae bacterium]
MCSDIGQTPKPLSKLEHLVMDYVWAHGPCGAEAVRKALASGWPMKESTVRTILRRLEQKGYVRHETEGRTYIYHSVQARQNVALRALRQIIDKFCGGSVERLLVGMVESELIDRRELERLARRVTESRRKEKA